MVSHPAALSILVPYRPDGGPRDRLWAFCHARLTKAFPEAEIVVSDDQGDHADLFNRPQALNRAARQATAEMFLIADADTTYSDPGELRRAVAAATEAPRRWMLPALYRQLTEASTEELLAGRATGLEYEWVGTTSWSGLVLVPAVAYWAIGAADERYVGWGADDAALGLPLETLYGPHVRWPGSALHLWHPRGFQENGWHDYSVRERELTERYAAAAGDEGKMRALTQEKMKPCGRFFAPGVPREYEFCYLPSGHFQPCKFEARRP